MNTTRILVKYREKSQKKMETVMSEERLEKSSEQKSLVKKVLKSQERGSGVRGEKRHVIRVQFIENLIQKI